ncbi:hypothetical protein [Streptomyces ficellus]|nr:hypothetical protein [Streptomyces ficellus]QGV77849.1 hypothetical protein EIZ62_06000 [Streptomyces ficellus]
MTRYVLRRSGVTGAWYAVVLFVTFGALFRGFAAIGLAFDGGFHWRLVLWSLAWFAVAAFGLWVAGPIGRTFAMRIQPVVDLPTDLSAMTFVLYLRSFGIDRELADPRRTLGSRFWLSNGEILGHDVGNAAATEEEKVARFFRRFGKLLAIGHPGDTYPLPGIDRSYLKADEWKSEVSELIRRARLVLLVAGTSHERESAQGTLWEFTEAVKTLPPARLLLLLCTGPDAYHRFRDAAAEYFAERGEELGRDGAASSRMPMLPDYPPLRSPRLRRGRHPLRGVIRFADDWTPELVLFDPTVERGRTARRRWRATVKAQVDPLLERLEDRLPGQAVQPDTFRRGFVLALAGMAASTITVPIYGMRHDPVTVRGAVLALAVLLAVGFIRTFVSLERNRVAHDVRVLVTPEEQRKYHAGYPARSWLDKLSDEFAFFAADIFFCVFWGTLCGTLAQVAVLHRMQNVDDRYAVVGAALGGLFGLFRQLRRSSYRVHRALRSKPVQLRSALVAALLWLSVLGAAGGGLIVARVTHHPSIGIYAAVLIGVPCISLWTRLRMPHASAP